MSTKNGLFYLNKLSTGLGKVIITKLLGLTDSNQSLFLREFVRIKFEGYLTRRILEQSLSKNKSANEESELAICYPPMNQNTDFDDLGNIKMLLCTAGEIQGEHGNPVIWAKDDKLICPFCDTFGKMKKKPYLGRSCFQRGGQQELFLGFLGFWLSDSLTHIEKDGGDYASYYCEEENKKIRTFFTETIEVLPVPVNVLSENDLEVFLLIPRICYVMKQMYFWQYRLIDRFVLEENFNNRCHICNAADVNSTPEIKMGIYYYRYPKNFSPTENKSKFARIILKSTKKILCNTCHEYMFLFGRREFNELEATLEKKGLCAHCLRPVKWEGNGKKFLSCPECNSLTPIYQKDTKKCSTREFTFRELMVTKPRPRG